MNTLSCSSVALPWFSLNANLVRSKNEALALDAVQRLAADDGQACNGFGWATSVDGRAAVIGADSDSDNGFWSGAAYVFARSSQGWMQQQKLVAPDGNARDHFGFSVSLSGDTAAIGAHRKNSNAGAVYIFVRSGDSWILQQKLEALRSSADMFGYSVSVDGDSIAVGAFGDDDNGACSGAVYIFARIGNEWSLQQKLTADNGEESDCFGSSVSLSGNTVAVGAFGDDDNGACSGAVYIFARIGNEWSLQQKLTADDGSKGDCFGSSVSLSGSTVAIGAHNGCGSGLAYIFACNGDRWNLQQKLTADDEEGGDTWFGAAVSLSGDAVVVGANREEDNGSSSGAAYVFVRSGDVWQQKRKLTVDDGEEIDYFGTSVAVDANTVLVGAGGNGAGSAYMYKQSAVSGID